MTNNTTKCRTNKNTINTITKNLVCVVRTKHGECFTYAIARKRGAA